MQQSRFLSSIRGKILAGFLIVMLVMSAATAILYVLVTRQVNAMNLLIDERLVLATTAQDIKFLDLTLADAVRGILLQPSNTAERDRYDSNGALIDKQLKAAKQMAVSADDLDTFGKLDSLNTSLVALEADMMGKAATDQAGALATYSSVYAQQRTEFAKLLEDFANRQQAVLNNEAMSAMKQARSGLGVALAAALASLLVALLVGLRIASGIANPITGFAVVAERVAGGDLTVDVRIRSNDEVGRLGQALDKMVGNLREVIRQIANSSGVVATSSEQMTEMTGQLAHATQGIASAVGGVAQGANGQSKSVRETIDAVEQLQSSIRQIADGAQEQAQNAQFTSGTVRQMVDAVTEMTERAEGVTRSSLRAVETAREGADIVNQTVAGIDRIRAQAEDAANRINELGTLSGKIGDITQTITDIADQTNLLALNAAIEAARAGEQGKGFAVVAEEVRKLAERAGSSAKEIAGLIHGVQDNTEQAVKVMERTNQEVALGTELAQKAGSALDSILAVVEEAGQQMGAIAQGARNVASSSREVMDAVESMAAVSEENTAATEEMAAGADQATAAITGIAAVTEENAASAEEVSASTEETSATVEELASLAQGLSDVAQRLRSQTIVFKLPS